jgi:hypothetical protein
MTSHPIVSYYLATIMMEEHHRAAERSRRARGLRKRRHGALVSAASHRTPTAEEVERVPSLV